MYSKARSLNKKIEQPMILNSHHFPKNKQGDVQGCLTVLMLQFDYTLQLLELDWIEVCQRCEMLIQGLRQCRYCGCNCTQNFQEQIYFRHFSIMGPLKNYVDRRRWVYGQSTVCLFLFTQSIYQGQVGGQKSPKTCLRSY